MCSKVCPIYGAGPNFGAFDVRFSTPKRAHEKLIKYSQRVDAQSSPDLGFELKDALVFLRDPAP